jgi:uncharacterized protein YbjT (DUF2867 family)
MSGYGVIILGGTGQVGSAVVRAFLNSPNCSEVVLLSRRPVANSWGERVRVVTVDPEKANFAQEVAALVQACAPRIMFGVSCVGVGSGSNKWSEEELIKLEVGIVGAFARGCKAGGVTSFGLLTAAGTSSKGKIRYARVMGLKEEAVQEIGFSRLAIFRPGIIAGNVHTPGWLAVLGRFIPGSWGTVDQETIGRAFVGELERKEGSGTEILHNADMRRY